MSQKRVAAAYVIMILGLISAAPKLPEVEGGYMAPNMNSDIVLEAEPHQLYKSKRSRTSTQKTRTGCITCKKRHIKCDETRPHCINCINNRGHCEGYAVKPKSRPPGQLCWDSKHTVHATSPKIQLLLDPDSLDIQDTTGMLYFQEFVSLVQGPWITAVSNGDLWTVTLPQLTRHSSTLRSAAMAIGALSIWHRETTCKSLRKVSVPSLFRAAEDTHYFQAVAYYCHSLKMHHQQASLRDTVFFSVLLLLFETLRGNRKVALDHMNHGLTLLLTILTDGDTHHHVEDFAPDPKPLIGAVADTFSHLVAYSRAIHRGRVGQGPVLPNFAKGLKNSKQTLESFMTILSQFPPSSVTGDHVPVAFGHLDEFEEHWVAFRRRNSTISTIMLEIIQCSGMSGSIDEGVINKFYLDLFENPRVREYSDASIKTAKDLDNAFLPLFNRIMMSDVGSPTYLKAIHLRLRLLGVFLFEDPSRVLNIESMHSQTPGFSEYLSLARVALRTAGQTNTNPAYQVSLQCGLASSLLYIAFFCRDPLTRDEAVWMLGEYPGQDGLWNTRGLYALALRNRDLELANAAEGTPTEQWQRFWRREFLFEDGGDRILFRYLEKDGITGEWRLVEEAAEIQEVTEEVHWVRQQPTGSEGLLMFYSHQN